jgi:hypothetical protein
MSIKSINDLKRKARSRNYDFHISYVLKFEYVTNASRSNRSFKITSIIEAMIMKNVQTNKHERKKTSTFLRYEHEMSSNIIFRVLKRNEFRSCKSTMKLELNAIMMKARLQFCLRYKNWIIENWKNVILMQCYDESMNISDDDVVVLFFMKMLSLIYIRLPSALSRQTLFSLAWITQGSRADDITCHVLLYEKISRLEIFYDVSSSSIIFLLSSKKMIRVGSAYLNIFSLNNSVDQSISDEIFNAFLRSTYFHATLLLI